MTAKQTWTKKGLIAAENIQIIFRLSNLFDVKIL